MADHTLIKVAAAPNRPHAVWRMPDGSEITEPLDSRHYTPTARVKSPVSAWLATVATLKGNQWVRGDGAVFVQAGDYAQWNTPSGFLEPGQIGPVGARWLVNVPGKGVWELEPAEAGTDPVKDADVSGDGWSLRAGTLTVD